MRIRLLRTGTYVSDQGGAGCGAIAFPEFSAVDIIFSDEKKRTIHIYEVTKKH